MKTRLLFISFFYLLLTFNTVAKCQEINRFIAKEGQFNASFSNKQEPLAKDLTSSIIKGKVIKKIVCNGNESHSYSVYLPSNYTSEKKWPVLYCFDPSARGSVAVEQFKSAGEQYGYIIIGSNNSQNGPNIPINDIVKNMVKDSQTKLSIDDNRVYAAGLSGGARIASLVANASKGYIVGVIACSGGFPPDLKPSRSIPFIFFSTAGTEDFNFTELNQLHRTLDEFSIPNKLEIFEGGHVWAPEEVTIQAVEWLEIQAMKTGKKAKNDTLIDQLLNKRLEKAKSYKGNLLYSYSEYASLVTDFKGLTDISEFEKILLNLKDSKEFKQVIKQQKEQEEQERNTINQFLSLKANLSSLESRTLIIQELKNLIQNIKKQADEKGLTSAKRELGFFLANIYEETNQLIAQKNYELAVINYELALTARPTNPRLLYNLSFIYSLKGEKKKAIETLKKAVENGFKDIDEINNNKAFDFIREDTKLKKIVESLKS